MSRTELCHATSSKPSSFDEKPWPQHADGHSRFDPLSYLRSSNAIPKLTSRIALTGPEVHRYTGEILVSSTHPALALLSAPTPPLSLNSNMQFLVQQLALHRDDVPTTNNLRF
eukprot:1024181-Rhodomonas_salina.2